MAITHIGNIAHINQNTLLNSQLQAAQQNANSAQNLANIQDFTQKMQENLEVRKAEESKAIDKDGESGGNASFGEGKKPAKQSAYKKPHENIYGEGGILDIKV